MSKIEWTDATWNPLAGCSVTSPGCTNCYAMRTAGVRLRNHQKYAGTTKMVKGNPVWTGQIGQADDDVWTEPLRWRKPRRVFVNSMGDLFHPNVTDAQIDRAFAIMALCPQHVFQILTKQAKRMRDWVKRRDLRFVLEAATGLGFTTVDDLPAGVLVWPLANVHLGVSVEDQQRADERISVLLDTPAARRFISAEPLLGPLNLRAVEIADTGICMDAMTGHCGDALFTAAGLDWVIVGGESGPGSRVCDGQFVGRIVEQCLGAGVPVFVKQLGARAVWGGKPLALKDRKGGDMAEWPASLRVRQMPGEYAA